MITRAVDDYDGVKTGHLISHAWCLFPQSWFQCFKVECLVVLIIKKKSRNNKASRKY